MINAIQSVHCFGRRFVLIVILATMLLVVQPLTSAQAEPPPVSFDQAILNGFTAPGNPTSLQFGPDGRLYVSERYGTISALTIERNGPKDYVVIDQENIDIIPFLGNRTDTGEIDTSSGFVANNRQVTGILVTGTATNPVIYVSSSDPREGGGEAGTDTNLDTNSGIVSRLTWNGTSWDHIDLVRGLPRSEENHAVNGMELDEATNTLYLAVGGFTNMGALSFNFTYIGEYAYSAAILSIDLDAIGNATYDLPTLDDPTRPNNPDGSDINDPFGGNDGANQARLELGGPVQIYASGFRNPYDVVLTESGDMYSIDNGPNYNWGGPPTNETPGECLNTVNENNAETHYDNLHFITGPGFYGGHPAPVRANPQGIFGSEADSPVPFAMANPIECDYREPGVDDGALATWVTSTNGLAEYTGTNFLGSMQGDLLTVSYDGDVYRIKPDGSGGIVDLTPGDPGDWGVESIGTGFGIVPLDVTAQGDNEIFPGTIWVAVFVDKTISVFEPLDFPCEGNYDALIDEDGDGFDNADEIDNGTNPCSSGSKPPDNDGDFDSDLNDADDDNDGILDLVDAFQIDPQNGVQSTLPVKYQFFQDDPGFGFFGVGYTGLMINGTTDYLNMFEEAQLTVGGTAGKATVDSFTTGTAFGATNTQDYAFQWGVNVSQADGPFAIDAQMNGAFFSPAPEGGDEQGIYFGNGDQDNYMMLALASNGNTTGFKVVVENSGVPVETFYPVTSAHLSTKINLVMSVDPVAGTVQPKYSLDGGELIEIGSPITLTGELLNIVQTSQVMAVGLIGSFDNGTTPFGGTWDYVFVEPEQPGVLSVTPAPVAYGDVVQGTFSDQTLTLQNLGKIGDPDISVTGLSLSGSADFSITVDPTPIVLAPGQTVDIVVRYAPAELELDTGTLDIAHDGINVPLTVSLNGNGIIDPDPIYRVNMGGPELTDPEGVLNWSADSGGSPSPYANHTLSGANLTSTGAMIDLSSPTLPSYTPDDLFNTGRWDPGSGEEMTYDFPVDNGTYEVRLYFAETFSGTASAGARIWDAELEGTVPTTFNDVDRYALAGFEAGYMLENEVEVTDGSLTVRFLHQVENPELQAIEVYPVFVPPTSDLGTSVSTLDFDGVNLDVATDQVITLTNLGAASDPAITIDSISYSGNHATDFSDDFAGPVILQPGESTDVTVSVTATEGGTRDAIMTINHNGGNGPTNVTLTASAYEPGGLELSPAPLDFGQVEIGGSVVLPLTLTNLGSETDPDIEVNNLVVTGSNTYQFQFEPDPVPIIVPGGGSVQVNVTYTPQDVGIYDVTISAAHDGVNSPVGIPASGEGVEPVFGPTYRVNVGGGIVTDPAGVMDWAEDTGTYPSAYWVTGGNGFGGTGSPIDMTSTTLPADIPMALFQQERYDPNDGDTNELTYEFPVVNGTYEVRVYLAELYTGITGSGQRVFDAEVEGIVPAGLDDIDIYAFEGFQKALMVSDTVDVNDGGLSLRFIHVTENPAIKAIEIIKVNSTPRSILLADPDALEFGDVPVSTDVTQAITLINDGTEGAPDLTINEITFDDVAFTSDFVGPLVLAKDESVIVNVTFAPAEGGDYLYTMTIDHDGADAPGTLSVSGTGTQPGVLEQNVSSVDFGNVVINTIASETVEITNLGTAGDPVINVTALDFTGADATNFGHSELLPLAIAPGSSEIIDLTFSPISTGIKTAQLTIVNDSITSDLIVDLTGNATETAPTASAIVRIETGGDPLTSSTYNPSFYVENTSTEDQTITNVTFNISSAIVPDVVFDPLGIAGDSGGRCLFPDGNTATATGFIEPTDLCVDPFFEPYELGYNGIAASFNDFQVGENFLFGVDIDPISTKGTVPPGPDDAASVSGYELLGSVVTVEFSDGSLLTTELWRNGTSLTGSRNVAQLNTLVAPSIEVLGATSGSTVPDASQMVRVTGQPGATVSLLISEGEMVEQAGGGYDIDPYELNTILNVEEYSATIGAGGTVDVPITLLDDALIDGVYGGLNYVVAVVKNGEVSSNLSNVVKIEYDQVAPSESISFGSDPVFNVQEGQMLTIDQTVATSASDAGTPNIDLTAIDDATGTAPSWLTIPASVVAGDSVNVEIDVLGLAPGTYTATVTGAATGYVSDTFMVTMNVNDIVIIISEPAQGQNITGNTVTVTWTSTGGLIDDHIHLTLDDLSTTEIEPHVGSLPQSDTYTFTNVASGDYAVIVEMANVNHIIYVNTAEIISIGVDLSDQAPVVTNPGDQSGIEGNTVLLPIEASDPEGQPITYSATGLPAGLSIDTTTGVISGTIATGAATNSPYSTVITVSDGALATDMSFTWTVSTQPSGPAVTNMELIDVATGTVVRILTQGDMINLDNYTNGISIQANTSGDVKKVEFKVNGAVERTESVAPYTIAGDNANNYNEWAIAPGNYEIAATPTNNPSASVILNITVTQTGANQSPVVTNPGSQSNSEDDVVSLQIQASDPENDVLTYSASGLPAGLSIDMNSGLISGTITTGASTNSPYSVIVTVTDDINPVDVSFTWSIGATGDLPPSVTNPGNQTSIENDVISLQIQASDPEAQPLTYDVTGLPTGLSIDSNSGLISGTVTTGASNNSPYSVAINVNDGVNSVVINFTWTVTLVPTGPQVTDIVLIDVATSSAVMSLTNGTVVNLANYPSGISVQANTAGNISKIEFTVNGALERSESQAPYTIAGDSPGNGNYNPWNVSPGSQTITATPTNNVAGAKSVTITIVQGTANLAPDVTNPGNQTGVEDDVVSLQIVASDPEAQPLTYSANGLPAGLSIDGNSGLISGAIATGASANSPYSVSVDVSDGINTTTANFSWSVGVSGNLPPLLTDPGNQTSIEEDVISLQIQASDPEALTLTYSASGLPPGLSIDTDTGLTSGTITVGANNNSPYNVTVTVSDGVNSVNQNFLWTVNLPASVGGIVTGVQLVDAGTNTPGIILTEGAVVSLGAYPGGISIQANTSGDISKINFTVNGALERSESQAPYTIAGDSPGNGNYNSWNVTPGTYTITATPTNNPAGAVTITITVTN